MYEGYYRKFESPLFNDLINEYIPTALLFYSALSEEEVEFIYESLNASKDIYKIMSKIN